MALELSLHARTPSALADGPILMSLELRNAGGGDVMVNVIGGPSPFEYSIYAADDATLVRSASEETRRRAEPALVIGPAPPPDELALPPGNAAVYEDDLALLLTEPLAPGRYWVEAAYGSGAAKACRSARVALEVVVSKPEAMTQAMAAASGKVVIAEWHRDADGSVRLREREAGLGPLGHFADLGAIATTGPVRQGAMSLSAAYRLPNAWRWLAWLDGDELRAGVASAERWAYPTKPLATGLEAPALLPLGYTVRDAGAVFVVAGRRDGRACVRLVRIPPARDALPALIDVRFDKAPDAVPSATCVWTADGDPELVLGWKIEVAETTLVVVARVNAMSGEVLAAPKGVFTTLRSVPSVAFPAAIGPGEQRRAHALLAPASPPSPDGSQWTHVTFEMANPSAQTVRDLPALPAFVAGAVDRWVLPSEAEPVPGASVVAVAGADIWAAGRGAWTRIASGDVDAASVRLWAFSPRRIICSWFDRAQGYRWHRLAD